MVVKCHLALTRSKAVRFFDHISLGVNEMKKRGRGDLPQHNPRYDCKMVVRDLLDAGISIKFLLFCFFLLCITLKPRVEYYKSLRY